MFLLMQEETMAEDHFLMYSLQDTEAHCCPCQPNNLVVNITIDINAMLVATWSTESLVR
jgi:hypothetical protein